MKAAPHRWTPERCTTCSSSSAPSTTTYTLLLPHLLLPNMQRHSFTALNSTFIVDSEYQFVKELGQGAYGCVVSAKHRRSGEGCAIKKITNINTKVRLRHLVGMFPAYRYRTLENPHEAMPARNQVRVSTAPHKNIPADVPLGYCTTSAVIKT